MAGVCTEVPTAANVAAGVRSSRTGSRRSEPPIRPLAQAPRPRGASRTPERQSRLRPAVRSDRAPRGIGGTWRVPRPGRRPCAKVHGAPQILLGDTGGLVVVLDDLEDPAVPRCDLGHLGLECRRCCLERRHLRCVSIRKLDTSAAVGCVGRAEFASFNAWTAAETLAAASLAWRTLTPVPMTRYSSSGQSLLTIHLHCSKRCGLGDRWSSVQIRPPRPNPRQPGGVSAVCRLRPSARRARPVPGATRRRKASCPP